MGTGRQAQHHSPLGTHSKSRDSFTYVQITPQADRVELAAQPRNLNPHSHWKAEVRPTTKHGARETPRSDPQVGRLSLPAPGSMHQSYPFSRCCQASPTASQGGRLFNDCSDLTGTPEQMLTRLIHHTSFLGEPKAPFCQAPVV